MCGGPRGFFCLGEVVHLVPYHASSSASLVCFTILKAKPKLKKTNKQTNTEMSQNVCRDCALFWYFPYVLNPVEENLQKFCLPFSLLGKTARTMEVLRMLFDCPDFHCFCGEYMQNYLDAEYIEWLELEGT